MNSSLPTVAKIIATSFAPRATRERTKLAGSPMGYFAHSQNYPTRESILDLLKFTLQKEEECDPGTNIDIIIVNNDVGWEYGNQFLKSLQGTTTNNGKIYTFTSSYLGRSYGGYNHAFKQIGKQYDYFIFTEDDILVSEPGYALTGIELFSQTQNCGFVAYQGLSTKALDLERQKAFAAHGGVGLTSRDVLNNVIAHYGVLPHAQNPNHQTSIDIIRDGEVAFTNSIHQLDYKLITPKPHIKLYSFAYDVERGIKMPRYASLPVRILQNLKQSTYKILHQNLNISPKLLGLPTSALRIFAHKFSSSVKKPPL